MFLEKLMSVITSLLSWTGLILLMHLFAPLSLLLSKIGGLALKLTGGEAAAEYDRRRETALGRLIANRELPVLRRAQEIISESRGQVR